MYGFCFRTERRADCSDSPADQQKGLHNRWQYVCITIPVQSQALTRDVRSPDIPAYATVKPGDVFKIECVGPWCPQIRMIIY